VNCVMRVAGAFRHWYGRGLNRSADDLALVGLRGRLDALDATLVPVDGEPEPILRHLEKAGTSVLVWFPPTGGDPAHLAMVIGRGSGGREDGGVSLRVVDKEGDGVGRLVESGSAEEASLVERIGGPGVRAAWFGADGREVTGQMPGGAVSSYRTVEALLPAPSGSREAQGLSRLMVLARARASGSPERADLALVGSALRAERGVAPGALLPPTDLAPYARKLAALDGGPGGVPESAARAVRERTAALLRVRPGDVRAEDVDAAFRANAAFHAAQGRQASSVAELREFAVRQLARAGLPRGRGSDAVVVYAGWLRFAAELAGELALAAPPELAVVVQVTGLVRKGGGEAPRSLAEVRGRLERVLERLFGPRRRRGVDLRLRALLRLVDKELQDEGRGEGGRLRATTVGDLVVRVGELLEQEVGPGSLVVPAGNDPRMDVLLWQLGQDMARPPCSASSRNSAAVVLQQCAKLMSGPSRPASASRLIGSFGVPMGIPV